MSDRCDQETGKESGIDLRWSGEMISQKNIDFLIAGIGGQGTVVASDILSDVGSESGYDVKKSDILGLAVRGGSVVATSAGENRFMRP